MTTKLMKAALLAKEKGFEYIYSIVKSVYNTRYCHVVHVDDILNNQGKWIPASKGQWGHWHGRYGILESQLPKNAISRQAALRMVDTTKNQ